MKTRPLVAACAIALNPIPDQKRLVLVPEGNFRGIDGRPFEATAKDGWLLTPERGQQIVAALNQRSIDMVVDWEHATLKALSKGTEAPAAGWCKSGGFEYVAGVGICSSDWTWTERAADQIAAQEYRYLSPVFEYAKTGEVLSVLHVALTNTPNIDALPEALLAAAAQDFFAQNQPESSMNEELLERLRWMLNLPVTATADEIIAELMKAVDQIKAATGVAMAANGQHLFDAIAAMQTKIAANSQAMPDPAKYVPIGVVSALHAQIATLTQQAKSGEIEELLTAACSDGRLLGDEHVAWARELGAANPEALKAHLAAAPKIAALSQQQTKTHLSPAPAGVVTPEMQLVASQFGHDPAKVSGA